MLSLKTKKIALSLITIFLFSVAVPAMAALVTCGNEGQDPCTFSGLFAMFAGVINNILTYFVPALAIIGFIIAAIIMMTSGGEPGKFAQAKQAMIWIAVGVIITYSAWALVKGFITALGGSSGGALQFFGQ